MPKGYIILDASHRKTARTAAKKALFLPILYLRSLGFEAKVARCVRIVPRSWPLLRGGRPESAVEVFDPGGSGLCKRGIWLNEVCRFMRLMLGFPLVDAVQELDGVSRSIWSGCLVPDDRHESR